MEDIAGMTVTPRRVQGPGFELVGLMGGRGHHTAVWYPPRSPCRVVGSQISDHTLQFLSKSIVSGVASVAGVDAERAAVVYATGEVWSVAELAASFRRRGQTPGLRAGVELAWRVACLLADIEEEAEEAQVPCHGAIDPWRIAIRRDGQVILLGYGTGASREALGLEGAALLEAMRYAPPERFVGGGEDTTSDLYSLALVSVEWMTGGPIYRGDEDQIRSQARSGEAQHRLEALRGSLPAPLVDVMSKALHSSRSERWASPQAFADAIREVLASPEMSGDSLHRSMNSSSVDAPTRFVGLNEVRGDADQGATRVGSEAESGTGGDAEMVKSGSRSWRHVSLGGREGSRRRHVEGLVDLPDVADEEEVPLRIADLKLKEPGLTEARGTDLDGVTIELPNTDALSRTLLPPDELMLTDEDDVSVSTEEDVSVSTEEDVSIPAEVDTDGAAEDSLADPTVVEVELDFEFDFDTDEVPRERTVDHLLGVTPLQQADVVSVGYDEDADEEAPTGFSVEDTPTSLLSRRQNMVRLTIGGPDGLPFYFSIGRDATVAEAEVEISAERWLPRVDMSGQLVYGWRLADSESGVFAANETIDAIADRNNLILRRICARVYFVTLSVPWADGRLERRQAVSGALRAAELIAMLRDTHKLPPRPWQVRVDGVALGSEALLDDALEDGAMLELFA